MNQIEINVGGVDLTFSVEFVRDECAGAPWENSEGHGPVSDWERRNKRPGEMILNGDRHGKRFYDFQEACKIALRDGWGHGNDIEGETKRQKAARAAMANYEYLRKWCNDQWEYVGVIVTLLDDDGEKTEVSDSLWRVETFDDYHHEEARLIAYELACQFGTQWDRVNKETFAYVKRG